MKKWLYGFPLVVSFLIQGCYDNTLESDRTIVLSSYINDHTLDLRSFNQFEWDKVCVFHSYVSDSALMKESGLRSLENFERVPADDAISQMIFLKQNKIISSISVNRNEVNFEIVFDNNQIKCLDKENAIFKITQ